MRHIPDIKKQSPLSKLTRGLLSAVLLLGLTQGEAAASASCPDSKLLGTNLITNVCWSCILPLRISGVNIATYGSEWVPSGASTKSVCVCNDKLGVPHVGVVTSFWEPVRLIEFERTPGCLSTLGGVSMFSNSLKHGSHGSGNVQDKAMTFNHYHYYSFPLLYMLDLFTGKGCNPGGYSDMDLMYLSELDPTWNDPELALFANPEALLFTNAAGVASCISDAVSSLAGSPMDSLFWCAGTWGQVYPITGQIQGDSGVLRSTSLSAVRVLAQLHRRGFAWQTMGDEALCDGVVSTYFPKAQYKFTEVFPVAEAASSHKVGELVESWGSGKIIPAAGEDPIYLIWRWLDCCNRF